MMRFGNVKWLLCANLILLKTSFAAPPLPLDCGHYLAKGYFSKNSQGDTLLTLQKGSSSPLELILLGGSFEERMNRVGSEAVVDFYIPRKISSNHEPFVFVKAFPKTDQKFPPEGILKTRKDSCGLKKYAP